MAITGGCLCGKVRFTIDADAPMAARVCWCRVCQYVGAGSGTATAVFPKDKVNVTGPLATYANIAESGNHMRRSFCPNCGTPIFSEAEERPQAIVVRLGTLDDPSAVRPALTIWAKMAPAWACFDPALPQESGQGPPPRPAK
jgi:hypothetical protein